MRPCRHHPQSQPKARMPAPRSGEGPILDRKSTRLNSSHLVISYAVFCLKKKTKVVRMGDFLSPIRLSDDMFKAFAPCLDRAPGRLLHTHLDGCTTFASESISHVATTRSQ